MSDRDKEFLEWELVIKTMAALERENAALRAERDTHRARGLMSRAEIVALQAERDAAMSVLAPNMPTSGLSDACRQVKQAAISDRDNCEKLESRLAALEEALDERITEARVLGHGEGQEHALADVVEALKALEDRMREGSTCGNNDEWWADALAALRARLTGAPEP